MKRILIALLCAGPLLACGGEDDEYDGPIPPVPPRMLPESSIWYQDISAAPLDAESSQIIGGLLARGGFGLGQIVVDFTIEQLSADETTPMLPFTPARGFYEPDCDLMPVPVPPHGALENEPGYTCIGQGDCHLIVEHKPTRRLYEMWHADLTHGLFTGGCLAVWDLTHTYGPTGRGLNCTSADAAGFPIAPLLFSAEEVASGEIPHAIRLILPNDRIRARTYVAPATHATGSASGGSDTPPYGARFRLRADYPVHTLRRGAQVVARALQKYGMFLADGGKKALTARSDRFTEFKWTKLLRENDLAALRINDFEVVDGGPRYRFDSACVRQPPVPTP